MPPNQDLSKTLKFLERHQQLPEPLEVLIPQDEEKITFENLGAAAAKKKVSVHDNRCRCAVVGCGMMGQEHVSYMLGYDSQLRIDYLVDPVSVEACEELIQEHNAEQSDHKNPEPVHIKSEDDLPVQDIDLLVLAHPNYLHPDSLLRWGEYEHLTILVEKPVAVNTQQLQILKEYNPKACVWVAMEYRYIPAIAKLEQLLPTVGKVRMVTIRENRFPFLRKIGNWNRYAEKTGDSLVEKWQEPRLEGVQALVQRGVNYQHEDDSSSIIDSAYVNVPFDQQIMASLELCMFSDCARHQEEVVVTGSHGRLEAYLPENKVYAYRRPTDKEWTDKTRPPPKLGEVVYDCSDTADAYGIVDEIPEHKGYHYGSTAMEWYRLLRARRDFLETGIWKAEVTLADGCKAVEMGLAATQASQQLVVANDE